MRIAIYIHVAAVALCVAFSLADRSVLVSEAVSKSLINYFGFALFPCLLAWLICPIAVVVIATRRELKFRQWIVPILVEMALMVAQMFALLPAVQ